MKGLRNGLAYPENMEFAEENRSAIASLHRFPNSPPAQRRVDDFDNDVSLIFDLWNWPIFEHDLVWAFEDYGSHCILRHGCGLPNRMLFNYRSFVSMFPRVFARARQRFKRKYRNYLCLGQPAKVPYFMQEISRT